MFGLRIPGALDALLGRVASGVMSPRVLAMFGVLVVGSIRQVGPRTVTGMLQGAGLARVLDHKRAHRFFSHARWCPTALGCSLAAEVVRGLSPAEPIRMVCDGTLFRRRGRHVAGCGWYHDPTANTKRAGSAWGNSFVVSAIIVEPSFMKRPVALPVLAQMHDKHASAPLSHSQIAREHVDAVAAQHPDRRVHATADGEFACSAMLKDLPANATVTSRLKSNAALNELAPPRPEQPRRGRPPKKGARLQKIAQLAQDPGTIWEQVHVTRYGKCELLDVNDRACLWYGVLKDKPVRVVLVRDPARVGSLQIAIVSTDMNASSSELVERYAARWPIETTFQDASEIAGVGDPRNRVQQAVERTVPFQLMAMTLTILWYSRHLADPDHVHERRRNAPWYHQKTTPSVRDMYTAARRILITAEYSPTRGREPTPQEIHQVTTAWALAAA